MKSGTPNFVGVKLREAREARGLTGIALSELLGVTRQAVSQYETGGVTPHPEVMLQIAEKLRLQPHFFSTPSRRRSTTRPKFYRSMSSATKGARIRAERRYEWLEEIAVYLSEFVTFPKVNIPDFDVPDRPQHLSDDFIEKAADSVRRHWNLGNGPISNVVWLLENNGAVVGRSELGAETLDALSDWNDEDRRPYIMLASDKGSAVRSRFDASHELAHAVLHRKIDRSAIASNSPDYHLIETQAHRFAAAFLLPAASFANDFYVPTLDALQALKSKWLVAISMMVMRSEHLGFVSAEQAKRFWINIARRGWRSHEPLDDSLKVEHPRLLKRGFELLVDKGVQTRDQILYRLPYSSRDIEELAGLESGFLSRQPAPPVSLKPEHDTGNVVAFPLSKKDKQKP
jgi:Zn-dependent peptidase ImmA (M78 family)/transcriptional regulator with XRE-family HTH domain